MRRTSAVPLATAVATILLTQLAVAQPMQAGGLAPPPPSSGPPPPSSGSQASNAMLQRQLEQAGQEDSGRGLEFVYFALDGGAQLVSLGALSSGSIVSEGSATTAIGPSLGVGAGVRLLYFTVGPRFHYAHFSDWNLWTLNLDVGWHVPLGRLEPYGVLGVGYARLPRAGEGVFADGRSISASGFDVRLGGGFDYYVSNAFSVGAMLDVQLLRLARSGVDVQVTDGAAAARFASDASSVGLAASAGAVLGLHY